MEKLINVIMFKESLSSMFYAYDFYSPLNAYFGIDFKYIKEILV